MAIPSTVPLFLLKAKGLLQLYTKRKTITLAGLDAALAGWAKDARPESTDTLFYIPELNRGKSAPKAGSALVVGALGAALGTLLNETLGSDWSEEKADVELSVVHERFELYPFSIVQKRLSPEDSGLSPFTDIEGALRGQLGLVASDAAPAPKKAAVPKKPGVSKKPSAKKPRKVPPKKKPSVPPRNARRA